MSAMVCHWTHAHGPHPWTPLVQDPSGANVFHVFGDAPIQCPGLEAAPTKVRMLHRSPNHAAGQIGTLHDASPSGHVNERLKWVDYGEPIQWSHGQSESTGEWCGPGEYELVEADHG